MGKGKIMVDGTHLILRGRRPRPFRTSAKHQIAIARSDVVNVVRDGRYIHCYVRIPYMTDRPLRIWLAHETSARQLVRLLGESG